MLIGALNATDLSLLDLYVLLHDLVLLGYRSEASRSCRVVLLRFCSGSVVSKRDLVLAAQCLVLFNNSEDVFGLVNVESWDPFSCHLFRLEVFARDVSTYTIDVVACVVVGATFHYAFECRDWRKRPDF